jgi:hypothetical protein
MERLGKARGKRQLTTCCRLLTGKQLGLSLAVTGGAPAGASARRGGQVEADQGKQHGMLQRWGLGQRDEGRLLDTLGWSFLSRGATRIVPMDSVKPEQGTAWEPNLGKDFPGRGSGWVTGSGAGLAR